MAGFSDVLLPPQKRYPLGELLDQVDLGHGDRAAKASGFGIMIILSAVIATAGVLADSTATVIGAMIVAPLSTPILGIAAGIVTGHVALVGRSALWLLGGAAVTIVIGVLASLLVFDDAALISNEQILGRTSPGLLDLLAALATGMAGSFAIARRDLSAVLPGVAIAISLVPPLAVVGVALGHGEFLAAGGAFLLFFSNVIALVISGGLVFTLAGYSREAFAESTQRRTRFVAVVGALAVVVTIPLAINSVVSTLTDHWSTVGYRVASEWISELEGAEVTDVTLHGEQLVIEVRSPGGTLPPLAELRTGLRDGDVPEYLSILIEITHGETIEVSLD